VPIHHTVCLRLACCNRAVRDWSRIILATYRRGSADFNRAVGLFGGIHAA
jgi:hypothetical protein